MQHPFLGCQRLSGRLRLLLLFLLLPAAAWPALTFTQLLLDKGFVIISATMSPVSPQRLPDLVDEGMNVKIELSCTLFRKSGALLPDEPITNLTVRYIVKKDVLNSGYSVALEGFTGPKERWFNDTDELVPFLMRFPGVRVCPLSLVDEEGYYFTEIQFHVVSLELYPPLSILFNLIGNWNYNSPKVRSRSFNRGGIFND